MKHFVFLLLFGLTFLPVLNAQQVKEVVAMAHNDTIQVSCLLETQSLCSLQLQYSDDNGLTWNDCKTLQGDIFNQASGKKSIYWHCLKDGVIMGNFIFRIQTYISSVSDTEEEKVVIRKDDERLMKDVPLSIKQKGRFVVMSGCSFRNILSYSFMVGYLKKWGGYAKVKSSFGSKDKNVFQGNVDDAFYNGESKKGRFSVYAGTLGQLHPNIFLYVGVGYGNKWLQWETINNEHIEIQDGTYSGVDPEVGLLFKIKRFMLGGGFNCLIGKGHKNGEGNILIGVIF